MPMLGNHLIFRLTNNQVIASSTEAQRRLARTTLRSGEPYELLAFRAADNHLHVETGSSRRAAGEFARRLQIALRRVLGLAVGFEPLRIIPIYTQRHLLNVFGYVLGQEAHHDLCLDPLHEASNLPDLLGMRVTGSYTAANVRARLPRVKAADLWTHIDRREQSSGKLRLDRLADAAAGAVCLPDLSGRNAEAVAARRAAVQVGSLITSVSETARGLGIGARWARRLNKQPAPPQLLRAVTLQLELRQGTHDPTFAEWTPQQPALPSFPSVRVE